MIINERSRDLLVIINDILDIAKIEAGQLTVTIECFNLENLLIGIRNFFLEQQERLKKQHIYFDIKNDCDIANINIITDKTKLRQILINLISNAFKFTNQGSIIFGCRNDDNERLTFYVSDTGIGIPADKHQFIFKRFAQLPKDGHSTYNGTGLGLPIAKALVNLLGGNLSLQSEPGKGTTFTFSVNYNIHTSENKPAENCLERISFDFKGKSILIVEDDQFNAELIQEMILPSGAKTIIAKNGREAIDLALQDNPDVVLMDINLPDISGYEAIEKILKERPSMKIIVQTAYASPDDQKEAIVKGCVDYISKPIKTQKLLIIINKHLS